MGNELVARALGLLLEDTLLQDIGERDTLLYWHK